jgi:hypothetical protein
VPQRSGLWNLGLGFAFSFATNCAMEVARPAGWWPSYGKFVVGYPHHQRIAKNVAPLSEIILR